MTSRKCNYCLYYTDYPIVNIFKYDKGDSKFEIVRTEQCPVCLNLVYGNSKEIKE